MKRGSGDYSQAMIGQIIEVVNTLMGFWCLGIGHKAGRAQGSGDKGKSRPAPVKRRPTCNLDTWGTPKSSSPLTSGPPACNYEIYAGSRHLASLKNGAAWFSHTDWLGTERERLWITHDTGQLYGNTCSSLPFGDALTCAGGAQSTLHFTGKERDPESGLDDFGARYDSSSLGRFMSPDPKHVSAHLSDPQTFNRYAYARNNPLLYVDPDGRDLEKAWQDFKAFAKSLSVKATVGLGYIYHAEVGKAEARAGVAATGSIEISADAVTLSRSASAGFEAGQKGAKVGESVSVEQTVMTVTGSTLTGAEKPEKTRIDSSGLFGGNVESSNDKIGIGFELPAGDIPVVGGVDVEASKEGLNALKDAGKELLDSLHIQGPPPPPPPPPPPTCAGDQKKPCQ